MKGVADQIRHTTKNDGCIQLGPTTKPSVEAFQKLIDITPAYANQTIAISVQAQANKSLKTLNKKLIITEVELSGLSATNSPLSITENHKAQTSPSSNTKLKTQT